MKKHVYPILFKTLLQVQVLMTLGTLFVSGQTDTVFWFAAPEVAARDAYGRQRDRPIYLRVITLNQAANVTISQPAGGGMPSQTLTIPANSTQAVDLTPWIDMIEIKPGNTILNYGLKVTADVPVMAYYSMLSQLDPAARRRTQPEVFSLKGGNALGTDFRIPTQNQYPTATGVTPAATAHFNIVATEDNTEVTITPSNPITGHAAGVPFTITLNTGQTYAAVATGTTGPTQLSGSKVTSTKPIAITVCGDPVPIGGDVTGDQIVPVRLLGKKYIALNGWLTRSGGQWGSYGDDLFVVGTENSTTISRDGTQIATINAGETFAISMAGADATYIETSRPVALWQFSGADGQPGATQVPNLMLCTGRQSIPYVFSLDSEPNALLLNVVVANGGENDFSVNGSTTVLTGSMFMPVPGTNGNWLYCRLDLSTPAYQVGDIIKVENASTHFQLSVVEGSTWTDNPKNAWGATVGYFSEYAITPTAGNILGADTAFCAGDSLLLDATTPEATGYLWSNGETTPTIYVNQTGAYWVKLTGELCVDRDTIMITVNPIPVVDLGPDTSLCNISSLIVQSRNTYSDATYQWNNGAGTPSVNITRPGRYTLTVTEKGCSSSDSILVNFRSLEVDLGNDTILCEGQSIILNSSIAYSHPSFRWSTGATTSSVRVSKDGLYHLSVTDDDCSGTDSVRITIPHLTQNLGADTLLCEEKTIDITLQGNVPAGAYTLWSTGETAADIRISRPGTYWVTVSYAPCFGSDTITLYTQKCDCEAFMPNAFTPNGDGLNDQLLPRFNPGCLIETYNFMIFNRYGQLVYKSNKVNEGWNGLYNNGAQADVGTYFYLIDYTTLRSVDRNMLKRGDVTLIR